MLPSIYQEMQALELSKSFLSEDHPHVASSLHNVGSSLRALGRHDEALKYQMEANKLKNKKLKLKDPDMVDSSSDIEDRAQYRKRAKDTKSQKIGKRRCIIC